MSASAPAALAISRGRCRSRHIVDAQRQHHHVETAFGQGPPGARARRRWCSPVRASSRQSSVRRADSSATRRPHRASSREAAPTSRCRSPPPEPQWGHLAHSPGARAEGSGSRGVTARTRRLHQQQRAEGSAGEQVAHRGCGHFRAVPADGVDKAVIGLAASTAGPLEMSVMPLHASYLTGDGDMLAGRDSGTTSALEIGHAEKAGAGAGIPATGDERRWVDGGGDTGIPGRVGGIALAVGHRGGSRRANAIATGRLVLAALRRGRQLPGRRCRDRRGRPLEGRRHHAFAGTSRPWPADATEKMPRSSWTIASHRCSSGATGRGEIHQAAGEAGKPYRVTQTDSGRWSTTEKGPHQRPWNREAFAPSTFPPLCSTTLTNRTTLW